jgi:signal transduction histidine kinase
MKPAMLHAVHATSREACGEPMQPSLDQCLQVLDVPVVLLDADGRIANGNPAWRDFARTRGLDEAGWSGRPYVWVWANAVGLDDTKRGELAADVTDVLGRTLDEARHEASFPNDGHERTFQVVVRPLPDGGALVTHLDTSGPHELSEAKTRFAALAAQTTDYIVIFDANRTVLYANAAAQGLVQRLRPADESDLRTWSPHFANGGILHDAAERGVWAGDLVLTCADGTELSVLASIHAHGHHGGRPGYFSAVLRDFTEEKQREELLRNRNVELELAYSQLKSAQDQLLQSEKLASIGQLAAGVAHEINNPIGYVHSNLGTLQEYVRNLFAMIDGYDRVIRTLTLTPEAQAEVDALRQRFDLEFMVQDLPQLLAESREGIERVKKIVQDLKDFSHAGGGEHWTLADLHKGLDSTLNIVRNELKYRAEVIKDYGELPLVECLPTQLNQVFMNLLVNAGQALPDRGTITLRTGRNESQVWIEVSDSGLGMPPETVQKIFDPFFTTKPVGQGTGLGLSVSYAIVKKHNGRIEVESTPGQGSTFRIVLPISQPRAEAGAEP